jgi:hypothetical protein
MVRACYGVLEELKYLVSSRMNGVDVSIECRASTFRVKQSKWVAATYVCLTLKMNAARSFETSETR